MKILVTGGAGFIGSALCRFLIAHTDSSVVNVDKLTYAGTLTSLKAVEDHARYRFVRADICDAKALGDIFEREQPTAVVHLAAETHVDRSITGSDAFVQTNVVGTFTLLETARSYFNSIPVARRESFRILHVSTDEVYGSLGLEGQFREDTPYDPSSPYSASKAASDHFAMAWYRTYNLPVMISNCSNNYGPYQFPEKLIPLTILHAVEGNPLPVYGDGSNVRDWLHVDDHARALYTIVRHGELGQKYNVGGNSERNNLSVVQSICTVLQRLSPSKRNYADLIAFVDDRPGHDYRYAIDASKIEDDLGWRTEKTFESGLENTVRWYLDNEWWWRPLREKSYAGERLGLVANDRTAFKA